VKREPQKKNGRLSMAINEHPFTGSILLCDFNSGFKEPEMVKKRPVVVLSPKIAARPNLCTVVALSETEPDPRLPYHCQIDIRPKLPPSFSSDGVWVKGDMIYAVGFHRLDLIRIGKDRSGKRMYHFQPLSAENIKKIRECVLRGMGLSALTKHLG
jgi:mRNA interferase MazF